MTKKIKDIIKQNPEPAKGTVGVNPSDPWSAKANIAESGVLNRYLMSRGINPNVTSKEKKISHAKSGSFKKWRISHKFEEIESEESLVESASLDQFLKSRGINPETVPKNKKVAYAKSAIFIKWKQQHQFESTETIEEGGFKKNVTDKEEDSRLNKMSPLGKFRAGVDARAKKHDEIEKNSGGMTSAIDRLEKHLNKEEAELDEMINEVLSKDASAGDWIHDFIHSDNPKFAGKSKAERKKMALGAYYGQHKEEVEQIDEISKEKLDTYKSGSMASLKNAQLNRDAAEPGKHMSRSFADLHAKSDAIAKKRVQGLKGYLQRKSGMKPTSEDVFQDPQAATQTVFDGANNTNDTSDKKKQLSKSARMVKSIYKHHNMKEDTYDWEKDDKDQTSYGKKPKVTKDDEKSLPGGNKPQARAVLSGGTTLTGDERDTLEIDPMMKNRPDLNGTVKDLPNKKKNKINNI